MVGLFTCLASFSGSATRCARRRVFHPYSEVMGLDLCLLSKIVVSGKLSLKISVANSLVYIGEDYYGH